MPKVSIGLPVYNGENFIIFAIDSLLSQTYEDFELIISDNNSTDKTEEICRMYASQDKRIKYIKSDTNYGASWNYNTVYRNSKGKYFKWASHDDICETSFLERCMNILEKNDDVVLCYPKTMVIDAYGKKKDVYDDNMHLIDSSPSQRFYGFITRSAGECNAIFGLIRSQALRSTSLISSFNGSDIILLAQLTLVGKIHEIDQLLFFRRDHPNTSLRAHKKPSDLYKWFDAKSQKKHVFRHTRHCLEYFKMVCKIKLPPNEKAKCIAIALKILWWDKHKIFNELVLNR